MCLISWDMKPGAVHFNRVSKSIIWHYSVMCASLITNNHSLESCAIPLHDFKPTLFVITSKIGQECHGALRL